MVEIKLGARGTRVGSAAEEEKKIGISVSSVYRNGSFLAPGKLSCFANVSLITRV